MIDWDDAFDNGGHVSGSADFAARWATLAERARDDLVQRGQAQLDIVYGPRPRNRLDLFTPAESARGLVVFVHGGYWHKLDRSYWSQLATALVASGWALAIPGYTLAPEARIGEITTEIGAAIGRAAALVAGPIRLTGHSAGGHLVARMACDDNPLPVDVRDRLVKVMPISGVHDLRPLMLTRMNRILGIDAAEAAMESPLLKRPRMDLDILFWVGAGERPEFLRQNRAIAEAWGETGARVADYYDPGRHHFSVIEGLAERDSRILGELLG